MGLSAGAGFGQPGAGFYGHLIPSRVAYEDPCEFVKLTFYHSEHGVLLNLAGSRFCDETIGDHISTLCESGALDQGRSLDPAPLVDPPYYVIEVVPAITATFSGLTIDPQARVLDTKGAPIPGLLSAGSDAGGVFHRAYAGGLAAALVFGLRATSTALSEGAQVA